MTDYKALKKLADACRKAGIKHYKCPEFEFTLSDEGPVSNYKKRALKKAPEASEEASTEVSSMDQLTEEQLLFYSVAETENETSQ